MNALLPFSLARLPELRFGRGGLSRLPAWLAPYGPQLLILTGLHSFVESPRAERLFAALRESGFRLEFATQSGEPSPEQVDALVARYHGQGITALLAIGGGSVLDCGKAVAGLLPSGRSVMEHLEGVGRGVAYSGPSVPFIAVPSSAGTGSEASKNAVLSRRGAGGFKRSFRDEALVARLAVLDPELLAGCPPALIATDGLDALTQLIEPYTARAATPFTDALIEGVFAAAAQALPLWYERGAEAEGEQDILAYAAFVSGLGLALAGLGAVHSLASPLGALTEVPHGLACGALLAPITTANIRAMTAREPQSVGLVRYARLGRLLLGEERLGQEEALQGLIEGLTTLRRRLPFAGLGAYGLTESLLGEVAAACSPASLKNNPITLSNDELQAALRQAL